MPNKKNRKKVIPKPMNPKKLTVDRVVLETGRETSTWIGNCYAVSCAIIQHRLIEGEAVFGHYHGPIDRNSVLWTRSSFAQHGWIICPDGTIVDPTRWVFEAVEPYIFVADENKQLKPSPRDPKGFLGDEYDIAGSAIRRAMRPPLPEFDAESLTRIDKPFEIKDPEAAAFVREALGNPEFWTHEQLHWLANAPLDGPDGLEPFAKPIFEAYIDAGLSAYIPMDHQRIVLGEGKYSYVKDRD